MKVIGLIGGMSWESTLEYYKIINELVKERLGGLHSAKILLYSVDFEEISELQHKGEWERLTEVMIDIAKRLEKAGAEFLLICTNTMHKMADDIQERISIPLLNIVDVTAQRIKELGLRKVGLLGTKFTMEDDFYKGRLAKKHGINVLIPDKEERQVVHDIIYKELCLGIIKQSSREKIMKIIDNLVKKGAEGIILGCTELPLIIRQEDCEVPLLDTTRIHAEAAVEYAIQ
ncbi:MAG: aspartate racemase [Thermoproteota archaeon]|nr:MAG: aspartate racemase [Candidatus Korarchaeota archaeon]